MIEWTREEIDIRKSKIDRHVTRIWGLRTMCGIACWTDIVEHSDDVYEIDCAYTPWENPEEYWFTPRLKSNGIQLEIKL